MDALALLFSIKGQPVFLARGDIFNRPFIARILIFMKMLPVYRIRDGYGSLKKNDETFQKTIDVIMNKNNLVILPEGDRAAIRRLRMLKKGFARIAFQTEEANDYSLDIKIIPVGLDYDTYENYRGTLVINFGNPLSVSDYYGHYKESPVKAINQIRDKLSERMKTLMVHIESKEYYTLFNELREIYKKEMCKKLFLPNSKQPHKLKADQELVRILAKYEKNHLSEMPGFQVQVTEYLKKMKSFGLTNHIIEKGGISLVSLFAQSLFLLVSCPFFLYGLLNNYLPYQLPIEIAHKVKESQFHGSFKFVLSVVSFPVFYLLQTVLVKIIFFPWWIAGVYLISLPFTGIFAWTWYSIARDLKRYWKFYIYRKRKTGAFMEFIRTYKEIIQRTDGIVEKYS
jgi:1-acyl-sn-glycerol-3-phosphate acyltransferase